MFENTISVHFSSVPRCPMDANNHPCSGHGTCITIGEVHRDLVLLSVVVVPACVRSGVFFTCCSRHCPLPLSMLIPLPPLVLGVEQGSASLEALRPSLQTCRQVLYSLILHLWLTGGGAGALPGKSCSSA